MKISQKHFSTFLAGKLDEAASTKTPKKAVVENKNLNEGFTINLGKDDLDTFDQMVIGSSVPGAPQSMVVYKDQTTAVTVRDKNQIQIWDIKTRKGMSFILNDRNLSFLKRAIS